MRTTYTKTIDNTIIPNFATYIPNEFINNVIMTYNMKYLWIKNISDKAGNKAEITRKVIVDSNAPIIEFTDTADYHIVIVLF